MVAIERRPIPQCAGRGGCSDVGWKDLHHVVNQPTPMGAAFLPARLVEGSLWIFAAAGAMTTPRRSPSGHPPLGARWIDWLAAIAVTVAVRVMAGGIDMCDVAEHRQNLLDGTDEAGCGNHPRQPATSPTLTLSLCPAGHPQASSRACSPCLSRIVRRCSTADFATRPDVVRPPAARAGDLRNSSSPRA
jgi:hypothetical protein